MSLLVVASFCAEMPFELQPCLRGQLLALAPLTEHDFEALYAAASDPLIWDQHPYNTRWQRDAFERFFADAMAAGGALGIIDTDGGALIGTSRYAGYDADRSEIEIGWTFLIRARWGGRYNSELKALMLLTASQNAQTPWIWERSAPLPLLAHIPRTRDRREGCVSGG